MQWVREIRTIEQVWEVVNERKRSGRVNDGILMSEWKNYFKKLLGGGVSWKVVRGMQVWNKENGEDLRREEVVVVVRKMRNGKATKTDGILAEVEVWWGEFMVVGEFMEGVQQNVEG